MPPHSPTRSLFSGKSKLAIIDGITHKLFEQENPGSTTWKMYGYAAMAMHNRHTSTMKLDPSWVFVYDDPKGEMKNIPKQVEEDIGIKVISLGELRDKLND
jgi:hypothetical protein